MERVGQIEHANRDTTLARCQGEAADRLLRTGYRHRGRAVDGGDLQTRMPGAGGDHRLDLVARQVHHRHAAEAAYPLLLLAAMEDHVNRVGQAERTRGLRGRDLADAVAEHHVGLQLAGGEAGGQRRLHREQQRLRDPGLLQPIRESVVMQGVHQGPVAEPGEQRVDGAEAVTEIRVAGEGVAAHSRPLAAIAGKHEAGGRHTGGGHPGDASGRTAGLCELAQGCRHFRRIAQRQGKAMAGRIALPGGGGSDAGDVASGRDGGGIGGCGLVQRGTRMRRQQQQFGLPSHRAVGAGNRLLCRLGLADDDMGVGAAEPERRHTSQPGPVTRQLDRLGGDSEVQGREIDPRVDAIEMQRRGQPAMLQGQDRLEQPSQAGRRLEMADVGLDRTDRQRRIAFLAQRLADGGRFRRIADACAGAMGFEEGQPVRVDAAAWTARPVKPVEQFPLSRDRRQGDAVGPAVGIDAGCQGDGANRIMAGDRRLQPGQYHRHCPLCADIAVRLGRERPAQPGWRKHRGLREADERGRRQQQVDAGDDGRVDPAGRNRRLCLGKRDQGRGAGGIDREARAAQVEDVGDAVGQHGQGVARHEMALDGGWIGGVQVAVIEAGCAHVDADIGPGHGAGRNAAIFQRTPDHFEQQPLLRVHLGCLTR